MSTVTAAGVLAAVAIAVIGAAASLWAASADTGSLLSAGVVLGFTAVGAVVAAARPANAVGWLMLVGGVTWAAGNGGVDAARHGLVDAPGSVGGASAIAVGGSALRSGGWLVATVAVAMVFPDGRVGGRRRLPWLVTIAAIASAVGAVTAADANLTDLPAWHNPIALPSAWQPASGMASLAGVVLGLAASAGTVLRLRDRWRRGDAYDREQIALLAACAALPVIAAPLVLAGVAGGWLFSATALPLPFAIGFAVLARGLYDLRTAANRTLVWTTLSALVAGIYALVIAGLGGFLDTPGAPWLPWAAAAVTAVSFAPLRDELQRGVNRLTFGRWEEPYEVLSALGQGVEATADVDRLLAVVTSELQALGLEHVAIHDARGERVAGQVHDHAIAVPLTAYGCRSGTLRYQPPSALRPRDVRLLEDLAAQLGLVLHARQLTVDLARALERLVLAREEERRRLRRDLHDGLGPSLASHLLRLDLLAATVADDEPAGAELRALRAELGSTMAELRLVVEGLRPTSLDELGLAGALTQATQRLTAGTTVRLHLDVEALPRLPAAVEVAVFRIVTEAVTNVVRHAAASTCRIAITTAGDALRVVVRDDGGGMTKDAGTGHGLQTMRERAEELRGTFRAVSDAGTTIVAELPIGVPA